MKMWYILRLISPLIILLGLSSFVFSEEKVNYGKVVAKVGNEEIYRFEVENFVNKVLPIESVHAKSLNKKKYWDSALNEAVQSRLLSLYLKKHDENIYKKADKKATEIIKSLKKRFKSEAEYNDALINTGITEDKLKKIYIDLNIVSLLEEQYKSKGISDKELRNYYENNKKMFMTGESVVVKNCLISADARVLDQKKMDEKFNVAKQVSELMRNKKFDEAKKYCAEKPYPEEDRIYRFSKGYNIDDIMKLEKDQVGGPYKNIYGYLVVYVKEKRKSELLPFNEVKDEIESIMMKKNFEIYIKELIKKAQNENPVVIMRDNN